MVLKILQSRLFFILVIAIPAIIMLSRFASVQGGMGQLLDASGEWAIRMLIATLAITPIRMMFKGQLWTMWLFKRRRDLGLAAFLYAALHLAIYVVRQSNPSIILYEAPYKEYLMGWIAFVTMLALAVTSNDWSVHHMGTWWKWLQRLSYMTAVAAFLHWFWIRLDHTAAYLHFAPLVLLEGYRIISNFSRPARRHRPG